MAFEVCNILEDFENASPYLFYFFSQTVNTIEKLLADFNVQLKIVVNQSLIGLHHKAALLMSSHGRIQLPAPFCTVR